MTDSKAPFYMRHQREAQVSAERLLHRLTLALIALEADEDIPTFIFPTEVIARLRDESGCANRRSGTSNLRRRSRLFTELQPRKRIRSQRQSMRHKHR